jgi:hypothetical protein
MLCIPPIIEWADIGGAASIATTTAHPIIILRSMTILPIAPARHMNAYRFVFIPRSRKSEPRRIAVNIAKPRHRGPSKNWKRASWCAITTDSSLPTSIFSLKMNL